jgi:4-amino-4-deoxy-L-arabinose transferase-like glycosyltransferase
MSAPATALRPPGHAPAYPVARVTDGQAWDRWLGAAMLVGALVRLVRLDGAPLWLDEVITARWLVLPWREMLRAVLADNHPPLYFLVLRAWSLIAGTSPVALRLPSVACSWATIPLVAGLAGALGGRGAARWAAWFAALSPFLVHHGQEARMYSMVAALAAGHLLLLARFLTGRSRALGLAFVLTGAALVATHYYGAFLVTAEMLALLVVRPRPLRSWLPAWTASGLAILGAFLLAAFLATHHTGGTFQPGPAALPGILWSLLSGYALLPSATALHREGTRATLVYLPLAVPGLAALAVSGVTALSTVHGRARLLLALTLAATLLAPFAVGVVMPGVGLNPRYASAGLPALLALIGIGAAAGGGRRLPGLATATLCLAMLAGSALHMVDPLDGREDVRAAGRWLDAHVPADEQVLVTSRDMATVVTYHWPDRRIRLYPGPHTVVGPSNLSAVVDGLPFADRGRVIYVLGRAWDSDPRDLLPSALAQRYDTCPGAELEGIRILCLIPRQTRL